MIKVIILWSNRSQTTLWFAGWSIDLHSRWSLLRSCNENRLELHPVLKKGFYISALSRTEGMGQRRRNIRRHCGPAAMPSNTNAAEVDSDGGSRWLCAAPYRAESWGSLPSTCSLRGSELSTPCPPRCLSACRHRVENRVRVKMAQTCCYEQSSCCAGKQRCLLEAEDKVMDITSWVYFGMAWTVLTFVQECLTACQESGLRNTPPSELFG